MNKNYWLLIILFFAAHMSYSQCAMCRIVAESSQDSGETIANGLNSGILYLMSFPYILIVIGLVVMYFREKKIKSPNSI